MAGVDLVRIDGSFPSFSDDDAFILYNEGFTGVSAVARDGSNKQLIFKVAFHLGNRAHLKQHVSMVPASVLGPQEEGVPSAAGFQRAAPQLRSCAAGF